MAPADVVHALRAGDDAWLESALEADPTLARARDANGVSVICLAVYLGRQRAAQLFRDRRTDLDLFEASTLGDAARVRALLDEKPERLNAYSPDGFHSLGYACFFGRTELLELLLARGADLELPARNPMQVRPLHSAVAHSDGDLALSMARRLLEAGASANVVQQGGFTPLHEAALRGHAPLVELLLANFADPLARNAEGKTPSDCAREAGHVAIARRIEGRHAVE